MLVRTKLAARRSALRSFSEVGHVNTIPMPSTLIISDLHLTHHFNRRKFEFLRRLFSSVDQVILNGDFWDGYMTTFDKFMRSRWAEIFPLLKSKHTIYIFGNHDAPRFSDSRVKLFCDQTTHHYQLKLKNKTLRIEHGDEIMLKETSYDPGLLIKISALVINGIHWFGTKFWGTRFYRIHRVWNTQGKEWVKQNLTDQEIIVTGHTHSAEFSPQDKFINSGCVQYGFAQYLLVKDGTIEPMEERY